MVIMNQFETPADLKSAVSLDHNLEKEAADKNTNAEIIVAGQVEDSEAHCRYTTIYQGLQ